jgi:hypothetical protein
VKKIYQLLLLLGLAFGTNAHADLLIEPLVGYSFGRYTTTTPSEDDETINGTSYGGRLGYSNLGLQLGVDYLNSNVNVKDENDDLKATEWAGFVGFKFPILFRVYAGYVFSGSGELGNLDFSKGTGMKAGVGFTGLPFININLEYRKIAYDEVKVGSVELSDDYGYNAYMISLSLPFTL